ncbi:hypothetical protein [Massilia cavernae]|uniref:hypothetical protein n=1 Tax=Massilia cavernae TaxID=2320864 RepID=UPI0011C35636|nr:hypothetical protein [Massilia cavernae]
MYVLLEEKLLYLESREMVMRYQNRIVAVATVLLGVLMLAGTAFTGHFPQATRAEAVGFDALAHNLFAAGQPQPAKGSAR